MRCLDNDDTYEDFGTYRHFFMNENCKLGNIIKTFQTILDFSEIPSLENLRLLCSIIRCYYIVVESNYSEMFKKR
jgi:hypothetical protein